jgi:phage gp45-like
MIGQVANRVRGLFRFAAVKDASATALPQIDDVAGVETSRSRIERVHTFGFKAVPKAGTSMGEPLELVVGTGADALAIACVDFRYEPADVTAGNSCMFNASGTRLDLKGAGAELNAVIDTDGYKTDGNAGVSGQLVIIDTGPTGPLGQVTMVIKGGIITSVACLPPAGGTITWTAAP